MKVLDEGCVVALQVVERAAHPGEALAETEIVGRIGLWGLTSGPIPPTAVLEVDHVKAVAADDVSAGLQPEIVDATERFLEDLRAHDGRADRENNAVVKVSQ